MSLLFTRLLCDHEAVAIASKTVFRLILLNGFTLFHQSKVNSFFFAKCTRVLIFQYQVFKVIFIHVFYHYNERFITGYFSPLAVLFVLQISVLNVFLKFPLNILVNFRADNDTFKADPSGQFE